MESPAYVHVRAPNELPEISHHRPFRAVVVLEINLSEADEAIIAEWLATSGCLYMMAWGQNCSSFHDAVDWANIRQFDPHVVPDEAHIMTTCHDNEPLEEVFWFAEFCANDPYVELNSLIVHVSDTDRGSALLSRYAEAQTSV